jgi:hypothetical protein
METFSNNFGESFYQQVGNTFSADSQSFLSSYRQMFGAGSVDKLVSASKTEGGASGAGGGDQASFLQKATKSVNDMVTGLANSGGSKSQIAGMMQGGKVDLPKLWQSSEWNFNSAVTVKLLSPTSRIEDVYRWIMAPVFILQCLAAPISTDGGDTYFNPPFLTVKFPTIWKDRLCGFKSLEIEWGGDTGLFTPDQLPLAVNLNITFEPMRSVVQNLIDPKGEGSSTNSPVPSTFQRLTAIADLWELTAGKSAALSQRTDIIAPVMHGTGSEKEAANVSPILGAGAPLPEDDRQQQLNAAAQQFYNTAREFKNK